MVRLCRRHRLQFWLFVSLAALAGCALPGVRLVDDGGGEPEARRVEIVLIGARPADEPAPDELPLPQPVAPPASPLTLDQVIQACLLNDPRIRIGLEAVNQSRAESVTAGLKPNPKFNIDQTLLPLTRPFTVDKQGGPPQLDVGLQYSIDWLLFGKRAAAMTAAAEGIRVSAADYANVIRKRVSDAGLAYYNVLEAKALLELARQDVQNLQRVETITRKVVAAGGRPRVELSRVRLALLASQRTLRDAEALVVTTRAQLRALLGGAGAVPGFDVAGTLDLPLPDEPAVDNAFAIAEQERPDLQSLRNKVAQARANTTVEHRKAFPEVTPKIGYTRQFQTKAIGFPDASAWGVGVDVTLPLYDRNQGNRLKADSALVQSHLELQATLVEVRSEIEQVTQELVTALANARAVAGEQLKLAREVRDSITRAYELGGRPLLDALDAQRNYRETVRLYVSSRANVRRAVIKYNSALGKRVLP